MRSDFIRPLALALGMACAVVGAPVAAQSYPTKPVKIVVPLAAGGTSDIYARFMAQRLQDALGQPFVIDNRPGAGSVIGTDVVAKAVPDGFTLLLVSSVNAVTESLIPNKPFQLMRDFVAVAPINYSDLVLVANPALPAATLKDLIDLAKARPGKLNYASAGPGSAYHMAGEQFKSMAGVYLVHIPYRAASGARTDVIGGQVDVMFDGVTSMAEQVKAGKVKALATTGKARSDVLPNVPTMNEAGVPGYEMTIWMGLMAPRGTPRVVVDRLNEAVSKIVGQPEVKQLWGKQGAVPMVMTPEAFESYARDDIAKWARVIKAGNIKVD